AVELAAGHYAVFVGKGQLSPVIRGLTLLRETRASEDGRLCFAGAVVTAHAGDVDRAEHWLELAERAPPLARDGQDPAGPLAALAASLRLLRGDIAGTVENGRRALAAARAADPVWTMVLASGLWWSGEVDEAKAILE